VKMASSLGKEFRHIARSRQDQRTDKGEKGRVANSCAGKAAWEKTSPPFAIVKMGLGGVHVPKRPEGDFVRSIRRNARKNHRGNPRKVSLLL